jgi:hypothetical protein
LAVVVLVSAFFLLSLMSAVHAQAAETSELAAVSSVAAAILKSSPQVPEDLKDAVKLSGACHEGAVVFTVKNMAKRWHGRGHLRVMDGKTGHMLRERWVRFNENQSISFRLQPDLAPSGRFRVAVITPDRSIVYAKRFRGSCPQSSSYIRAARR